jgi:anaerobic selenocysteine-containing dehydrogenase
MKAPLLADAAPRAFVAVNLMDAAELGIEDGDPVRVTSRRGSVTAPAKVGDVVAQGVVFIPFHFGELGGGTAANDLMPKTWDPVSKQPIQKFAAVRLERVSGRRDPWWLDDSAPIQAADVGGVV